MASSKTGAALTVAAAVSGACAFVAPSSSGVSTGRTTPALRGQVKAQEASSYNSNAAAAVAVSTAAVLVSQLRKAGTKTSDPRMVALRAFEQELGVQPPVGYWDPAGLAKDGDVETFKRRRSVELKHGRIAMLATMGYITPEIAGKFPGYLSPSAGLKFADVPNGLAAISKVPAGGWTQILLYMGWCEVSRGPGSDIASGRPGDFGWYVLTSADPEAKKKKLSAELANGRLAMMAIIGMFYQDGLTGSAWGDWSLYTDSPLRAAAPDFSKELGVTPPLGFWDPLGFSKYDDPELAKSQFQRRRIIELQHGRVAMLACIGYIVPEYFRWPGYCSPSMNLSFTDIPNGLKGAAMVPLAGWLQIITFVGIIEVTNLQKIQDKVLGDYGYGAFGIPFGKKIENEEKKMKSLTAEINNGRLAMMAIIGMFYQDGLTGSAWGDWANYADSPLRAFEEELGVQAPVGFWDPVGYTRDGDMETFKRRRETEIKHGRVAMYATTGYIVPEYFKWPGYLSPSMGLKFSDVPNGLAAISKVPGNGWAQIVAFAGYYELFVYKYSGTPGDYGWKAISSTDPETKKRKLNAELANGRLAMMAIIGMFFQDGLTGSAWGDWANYTDSPLRAFENETGVQPPVGFWDPLGLSTSGNLSDYKRRREVELKHGRVAMFATIGYILPEYWRFPGYLSKFLDIKFSEVPNGLSAFSKVPSLGWLQIVGFAGIVELNVYNEQVNDEPGNYGAGFLGLRSIGFMNAGISDPEVRKKKLNAELANGRLAMFAIIGMFFQDGLTGSAWGDWANYTDSPLRAFENELGVQAPVGFWDPAGFTADGSVEDFKRRRATEIKHGRISMLATMGYITPEITGKFPGYLSPSAGLKFADVPNGLAAISKVPAAGWGQILAYMAFCEVSQEQTPGSAAYAGDFGFKVLTSSDPAEKTKKLNAEIANGRLAMMAIIGMFFQDGLTGSAWGDWANYTASPLRAFENEMGAQPPFGFWDPVGFTADGDVDAYKRRRQTEIKHGRIAMLATMGYMTPEITGKWPGFLSPSAGLKFEDVPNGLAAISKVPVEGWAQILGWMAFCETSKSQAPGTPGAVGDFGWKLITSDDPVVKERKLASELANGRLAMVAIMGMFFQDGLTGSAFGDFAIKQGSAWLAFENELGVQAPVGFWDPAGFTADGSVENFKRRRQTELKHGRISMLATMGYITPEITGKFPGYLSPSAGLKFADVPNGLAAISKVPAAGWGQILAYMAFCEVSQDQSAGTPAAAGDFGFKVLTSSDPAEKTKKLSAELANGRLAMMAIIGMFFQDGLTGSAWGDWANYTASPLRAFENELGVQAPIGFFDPFGMTKDGDMEAFKRRRATELKNGRVAMLATMGYIVPEYFRFPGFCSPSEGVKFADIPNGLAAISKVPAAGWTQWFLFLGLIEKGVYTYDPTRSPGDFKNAGVLGVPNGSTMVPGEGRNRKLNSELANGRLAMMAIIGMFFQDGLTGSAWGDWAQYTDSPLRAFENELGVQAPVGYWDPMGMSKDGDLKTFRRRREAELKNGRVAMFATLGFITPEYFRFPGYLSPAKELKFSDVPNGLAAFSKVPLTGWIQILIFCGMVDFGLYRADDSRDPGDYENAGILGVPNASGPMSDVEGRKRKLNSELANGRLAMVAITGMLFQNGMFGTTGPAMWGFGA